MSLPSSPSPPAKPIQPFKPQLPLQDLSILSTPSFSSTLPLSRRPSASNAFRRSSLASKSSRALHQRPRRTRSVATSVSRTSDGSLGEFSMENYTIDIAQLARKEGGARPVGYEQAFQIPENAQEKLSNERPTRSSDSDGKQDILSGYEIDLGGFGDKPSSVLVEDAAPYREEVHSDDDGPEDFTQNLEAWMRGTQIWKKMQEDEIAEGHEPDPDPEQDLREVIATDGLEEESTFEPLATSTPAPMRNHAIIEEGLEKEENSSKKARREAPPLTRSNTEIVQDQAAEEVFDRISALQLEVEKLRSENEAHHASYRDLEEEHRKTLMEHETWKEDHRNQLSAMREEFDQTQRTRMDIADSLRRENKDLIREYNSAMDQIRQLEKQRIESPEAKDDSLQSRYGHAIQELEALNTTSEEYKISVQSEFEALRRDAQTFRNESQNYKLQVDSNERNYNFKIRDLEIDLEARRNEVALERKESIDRANEVASLTENSAQKDAKIQELTNETNAIESKLGQSIDQLKETRRILEAVEEENDRLLQQHEQQTQNIKALQESLEAAQSQQPIASPGERPKGTVISESTHQAALQDLAQQHQTDISEIKTTHGKELQVLRNALLKAGEGMQKREKKLAKAHSDQISTLEQKIATLQQAPSRTPAPQPSPSAQSEVKELRAAIQILHTKLSTAAASLASAQANAAEARQQRQDAVETNTVVNAELEARFAEAVEKREREWRRRIEVLFRERDMMGKALMGAWGRDEVGKAKGERGQGYMYRYVERV
ncbi:hypothetical protein ACLMJK_001351 [Lecanora helva]